MVYVKTFLSLSIAATAVSAVPLNKRIAQTIADSTSKWEQACVTAGGGQQCNPISQQAFTSLLAAGGNCDQQNAADAMVDLAKQLNNNADMISLSQIFVQQPRNAPDSLQVPYCQTAPKNAELNGFFHCQFASSDFTKFSGDQTGNLPLGLTAVNPPGSCPAKTDGPVPDGVQLNTLVTSPGTLEGGASGAAAASNVTSAAPVAASSSAATKRSLVAREADPATQLQNAQDAQKANAASASLTADSACTDGQETCVGSQLGQCVGGKFVLTSCPSTLSCFTLPLLDKAGTSVACDTEADAAARIANTGATGGVAGSTPSKRETDAATQLQNAQDAQKANAASASLPADSACTDGQETCVGSQLGQCVDGKFVLTSCPSTLSCFTLPLLNKAGTSVACDTEADTAARIANAGATGGVTGAAGAKFVKREADAATQLQNAQDAQKANAASTSLTADSACTDGQETCVGSQLGQCVGGKFELTSCPSTLSCFTLPLVDKAGTSVACDTEADATARISSAGATGGITGSQ